MRMDLKGLSLQAQLKFIPVRRLPDPTALSYAPPLVPGCTPSPGSRGVWATACTMRRWVACTANWSRWGRAYRPS